MQIFEKGFQMGETVVDHRWDAWKGGVLPSDIKSFMKSYGRKLIEAVGEELEDCVPQGWCTKENEHKSMDADLVVAILKLMRLKLKEILSNLK